MKKCLAHRGAFTAVTDNHRLIGCEPFFVDADPTPMLNTLPELDYSGKRIRQPMI